MRPKAKGTIGKDCCRWCGKKLSYWLDKDHGKKGYYGVPVFCTVRCGWQYAIGQYGWRIVQEGEK